MAVSSTESVDMTLFLAVNRSVKQQQEAILQLFQGAEQVAAAASKAAAGDGKGQVVDLQV